jgi:CHAT domain-containing protein/tetratricopeptide (TPR) repeat protein
MENLEDIRGLRKLINERTGDIPNVTPTLEDLERRIWGWWGVLCNRARNNQSLREHALLTLGWLHFRAWEISDDVGNFIQCISYFQQCQELQSGVDDLTESTNIQTMALLLHGSCEESEDIAKIKRIVAKLEKLWQDTKCEGVFFLLVSSKRIQYRVGHNHGDLKSIISLLETRWEMLDKRQNSEDELEAILEYLCQDYVELFKTSPVKDKSHLESAIRYGNRSMLIAPLWARSGKLSNLVDAFEQRFVMDPQNNMGDLEICIKYSREAVQLAHADDPYRSVLLSGLSKDLIWRYGRLHHRHDLEEAITKSTDAVDTLKRTGANLSERNKSMIYDMLSHVLSAKFDIVPDPEFLNQAIHWARQSVEVLPKSDASRPDLIGTLPRLLLRRSTIRAGDLDDTAEAIKWTNEVLGLPTVYGKQRGRLLQLSSEAFGHLADIAPPEEWADVLERAISRARESITCEGNEEDIAGGTFELGFLLHRRYTRAKDDQRNPNDLTEALRYVREAIEAMPEAHPNRGNFVFTFSSFVLIDRKLPPQPEFQELCDMLTQVANTETMIPSNRIRCSKRVIGLLLMKEPDSGSVLARPIAEKAINLFRKASSRVLAQSDQQGVLRPFQGLVTSAAALMLSKGGQGASKALEILELGRGVINQNRMDLHADTTALKATKCEKGLRLAIEFESLRDQLYLAGSSTIGSSDGDKSLTGGGDQISDPNRFHRLSDLFDEKLSQIRNEVKGFENFLGIDYDEDEIKRAAGDGAIVYIVVAHECHAIIVNHHGITPKPLKDLDSEDIKDAARLIGVMRRHKGHLPQQSKKFPKGLLSILEWLWDVAVGPILDHVGFKDRPLSGEKWKRVWWIPTGALTLLPLHAAGKHEEIGSNDTALDRVVSSYSSSIKNLIQTRRNKTSKKELTQPSKKHSVLLVSMKNTPGTSKTLKHAEEEVEEVAKVLPKDIDKVSLRMPTKKDVLPKITSSSVFHFAGHGVSDPTDPSRSRLLLADYKTNPLTVTDLAALQLREKHPWLAYLAACSTGEIRDEDLYDEVIHLVNACQVAGFQHVVGSFWEISDSYSVHVAKELYATVGDSIGESEEVAYGLHRASTFLRDSKHLPVHQVLRSGNEDMDEAHRGDRYVEVDRTKRHQTGLGFGHPFIWAAYFHVGL